MNKFLKYFLIVFSSVLGLCIIGYIVFSLMVASAFGAFDKTYSKEDLVESYQENETEINNLINYYTSILPHNKIVSIEFSKTEQIERLYIKDRSTSVIIQDWDFPSYELFEGKYKNELGWTENQIKILKQKLDNADCISIDNEEPIKIGFKRSGMGMYSFALFKNEKTDQSFYDDNCQYIFIRKNLALQYGGGAIGPDCFPENY